MKTVDMDKDQKLLSMNPFMLFLMGFVVWITFFLDVPNDSPFKHIYEKVQSEQAQFIVLLSLGLILFISTLKFEKKDEEFRK